MFQVKRVYDTPAGSDGFRVLVDRLWPRGVSREKAMLDLWFKDIAPSPDLRKWFDHKPERFAEFRERYRHELMNNSAVDIIRQHAAEHEKVTLVYAARDAAINHAVVLQEYLDTK